MSFAKDILEHKIFKRFNKSRENSSLIHNKLATRNNDEIIFAIDSSIRYTKISELGNSFKILDIDIEFPIQGIKLNSSGTLLAIYNESNIVVSTLPTSNTSRFVKSFKVAPNTYSTDNKILSILWNKIARYDSSLIVLSKDSIIRSFELNHSITEPRQVYNLSSNGTKQMGLVSNFVEDPISICFGSASKLSGLLTLYILNQEGDIFSIYPFMPDEISVQEQLVEDLLNEIVLSTNSIFDDEYSSNYTKKLAIDQLRFINLVWKQIPLSQTEVGGSQDLRVLQNPKKEFYIQGPLSIQPYPEELYDDEALSLIALSNDTSDLLAVSFKKNGVVILYQETQFMKWRNEEELVDYLILHDQEEEHCFPVLSVLEHKVPKSLKSTFIIPLYGFKFLLENDGNYFKVDLSELGCRLSQSVIDGNIDDALSALTSRTVLKKVNIANYEGSGILNDAKGYSYEVVVSGATIEVDQIKESTVTKDEPFEIVEKYKTLLQSTCSKEIASLVLSLRQFNLKVPSQSVQLFNPDEHTLKIVNTVSSDILRHSMKHHKLGVLLNYRLIDQENEIKRQISKTNELLERSSRLQVPLVDKIQERQSQLNERFIKLSQLLQKNHPNLNLPLSTREKQWFKEVQNLVSYFNRSLKRNLVLNDEIKTIRYELRTRPSFKSNKIENWSEINQVLERGRKLIAKTSEGLNENLQELTKQVGQVHI